MNKQGVTNEKIVSTIKEGMEAQHPLAKKDPDTGKRPKDYHAIDKFTGRAIQARDVLPATKMKVETESRNVHIIMTSDDAKAMQEYKRMREESREIP